MQVISPHSGTGDDAVHTIDVWFSQERRQWVVQRLNGHGDPVGYDHFCRTEHEAKACVTDWMRRHPETHLTTPSTGRAAGAPRPTEAKGARA